MPINLSQPQPWQPRICITPLSVFSTVLHQWSPVVCSVMSAFSCLAWQFSSTLLHLLAVTEKFPELHPGNVLFKIKLIQKTFLPRKSREINPHLHSQLLFCFGFGKLGFERQVLFSKQRRNNGIDTRKNRNIDSSLASYAKANLKPII